MDHSAQSATLRKLGAADRDALAAHLLRLDAEARRFRFGGPASDWFVEHRVANAFEAGTTIHGVFVDGRLIGSGELRLWHGSTKADAALAIERDHRGVGLGSRLMKRILLSARNRGVDGLRLPDGIDRPTLVRLAHRLGVALADDSRAEPTFVVGERRSVASLVAEGLADTGVRIAELCRLWLDRPLCLGMARAL